MDETGTGRDTRGTRAAGAAAGALFALTGGLLVVAVAAALLDRPGGPVLVAEADRPVLLGVSAGLALAGAVMLRSRRQAVRQAAAVGLVAATVMGVTAPPTLGVLADPFPMREYDVPAPGGVARRLVVERTSPLFHPVWRIHVDQGSFPTARRWPVATYTDGDPGKGVLDARWDGPDRIVLVDVDHTPRTIPLAPSGQPLARPW
ncbi:hypothetical protein [Streptomyces sp. WAC06614]|uniref:hypothetical protein n=1 Tax=Streptomyces sp. WAC06614 TaxID=2487416 RepID=UPI000F7A3162|nr:hypothetical protein [Streptomyces sp. WAC06614]RSS82321.1 hypothetical protein EF918_07280 [Streptomyces sp. WAC06614]